ncbi:MAG: hypothetical protein ACRYG6_01950 [Janthinobacterium lividum]
MSDADAAPPRVITELKVSGHLMTLDRGVFCLFYAPGSAPPSSATGLPGVRLSLPPEAGAHGGGALSISTFREDGWLGGEDSAALIRVTHGPAQVLVTVYQETDGRHEAPRLQVMRLSGGAEQAPAGEAAAVTVGHGVPQTGAAAPAASPALAAPVVAETRAEEPRVAEAGVAAAAGGVSAAEAEVAAHVQGRGDVLTRLDEWMGERGSQRWIEGFAIAPRHLVSRDDIEYQAVLGRGWLSPWSDGGHYCGSRGMALPILGLRVRLRGPAADRFDLRVHATFVDGTAVGPNEAGEACEAESLAPLEAFHVEITARPGLAAPAASADVAGSAAPAKAAVPAAPAAPVPVPPATRKPARATFKPAPPPRGKPAPAGRGKR